MIPIILHLDMNSYFATAEQQDKPEWRGRPLGVCEHLGGIIIAASIEAKKWGIKTGTPVWEAKKLYPKIILTHTRAEAYRAYNRKLVKLVSDYTDKVEVTSIDEVVLDLTKACNVRRHSEERSDEESQSLDMVNPFEEAVLIAKEIKRRMKTEVGDYLTCSIGIAENKLLAKIASDMQKPNGLVIVAHQASSGQASEKCKVKSGESSGLVFSKNDLYSRLKLTDVPGIGRRMEKRLNELGIKTLSDLRNYPKNRLTAMFGIPGYHLYNMGQLSGSFKPAVEQEEEIKSIGHMYTLPKEFREEKFFAPVLYKLSEMVGKRLRRKGLMGNVINFYINDKNYDSAGQSRRLDFYIYDGREIFLQCIKIFEKLVLPPGELKLIGVTVSGLTPYVRQLSLFGGEESKKRVADALDKINEKYGDFTVCRTPILTVGKVFRDSVGFGRIKEL